MERDGTPEYGECRGFTGEMVAIPTWHSGFIARRGLNYPSGVSHLASAAASILFDLLWQLHGYHRKGLRRVIAGWPVAGFVVRRWAVLIRPLAKSV